MEFRSLGRSGLKVSVLALGTMTFGGGGKFAKVGATMHEDGKRQVGMALEAGVNLIDTADVYSAGLSEEIVGAAVAGFRDDVLLASKVRFPMGDGPNDGGLSRHHIVRGCEASLRRLGTDHLDLYQLHEWDGLTPVEEIAGALDHLVSSGKVRYVGVSNFSAWHVMKLIAATERLGSPRIAAQQLHYTLQAREAEYELLPLALDQGLGVLVWSPLAGGLLSGKYRRGVEAPAGSRHLTAWDEPPVHDEDKLYDTIETAVDVGEAHGVSAAQVSLAWLLSRPAVTSLIVGARTADQLRDNLAAADLRLADDELTKLDEVSGEPLRYPYWHQAKTSAERFGPADLTLMRRHLR